MILHPTNDHATHEKSPPPTFVAKIVEDMVIFMQIASDYQNLFALEVPCVDTDLKSVERSYATGVERSDTLSTIALNSVEDILGSGISDASGGSVTICDLHTSDSLFSFPFHDSNTCCRTTTFYLMDV